jgi:hypothetical protein
VACLFFRTRSKGIAMVESTSDNFNIGISSGKYETFCAVLSSRVESISDFTIFKDKQNCDLITQLCGENFIEEINILRAQLNNPKIGIAALDVPETDLFDKTSNTIYGAAIVMGVFNNIGVPNIDPINKMPFAVHTASHENARQLEANGVEQYAPEVKLGFHNDGLVNNGKIEIPEHIVVYNLYISYRRPGNFMWVPTSLWDDANKYEEISRKDNIRIKIKLSPSYYFDQEGKLSNSLIDTVETPLSRINENGEQRFFINGQVLPENNNLSDVNMVQSIRESLLNNSRIIRIPQKERRAFFLKNTLGFHARDVFDDPIKDIDLTRVFIRAVDLNAESYATY